MLVWSYSDTETIQAIMAEVLKTRASIIDPQYQKAFRQFLNTVKYCEEFLERLEVPISEPPCLPNQKYSSVRFPYRKANVNLVGWSQNIGTPSFPKDDKNISPRKTPNSVLQCKTHLSSTSKFIISFLLLHMQSLLHSCLK